MRTFPRILVLALVFVLAACGGDGGSTGPDNGHVGTYTLQTVNGGGLPFTVVQVGANRLEITAGRITLNADNTLSGSLTTRETVNGAVTTEQGLETGTYVRNGTNISYQTSDGETGAMTLSGSSLTQTIEGLTLVYRK